MKVLIVDDERNIRAALRDILEDEGYEVADARDGPTALQAMGVAEADIVLLDVKLPGPDGVSVLGDIRSRWPETEVVMISGHSGIETAVEALRVGAYDFLEKPLSLPKVRVVVARAAEKLTLLRRAKDAATRAFPAMIGDSPALEAVRALISRVAPTNATVLITGESGSGKELVSQQIHCQSAVSDGPFVQVNCAAIPHDLIESELFGHEKGSFTGATARRAGKFEQAHGGTLFLDEIGDMDLAVQAKVLRALQDGEFQRVGGTELLHADVRVIAATNKDLEAQVAEGAFREDLFYRLNVVPTRVPPLRERPQDVADLARHFLAEFSVANGREQMHLSDAAVDRLSALEFRGNVRELKNVVERLAIFAGGMEIDESDIGVASTGPEGGETVHFVRPRALTEAKTELEKHYIETQLRLNNWDIAKTAAVLDILPNNLHRKITQLLIERPSRKGASEAEE